MYSFSKVTYTYVLSFFLPTKAVFCKKYLLNEACIRFFFKSAMDSVVFYFIYIFRNNFSFPWSYIYLLFYLDLMFGWPNIFYLDPMLGWPNIFYLDPMLAGLISSTWIPCWAGLISSTWIPCLVRAAGAPILSGTWRPWRHAAGKYLNTSNTFR